MGIYFTVCKFGMTGVCISMYVCTCVYLVCMYMCCLYGDLRLSSGFFPQSLFIEAGSLSQTQSSLTLLVYPPACYGTLLYLPFKCRDCSRVLYMLWFYVDPGDLNYVLIVAQVIYCWDTASYTVTMLLISPRTWYNTFNIRSFLFWSIGSSENLSHLHP